MVRERKNIQVLVLEDHETLGEVGDIVDVKPGHARNYLIPLGIACPVTPDALRAVERKKKTAAEARARRAKETAELAKALEGVSLTLEERASEEGHLFGSVGAARIVEALAERGIRIEEKKIGLEEPIKELGIFSVPVRLAPDATPEIRVWVVEPE